MAETMLYEMLANKDVQELVFITYHHAIVIFP